LDFGAHHEKQFQNWRKTIRIVRVNGRHIAPDGRDARQTQRGNSTLPSQSLEHARLGALEGPTSYKRSEAIPDIPLLLI
jgi:hypothetical protein